MSAVVDCPCCLQGIRHVEKLQSAILAWCSEFIKDVNDNRRFAHPCQHLFSGSGSHNSNIPANGHPGLRHESHNVVDEFRPNIVNNKTISNICDELIGQHSDYYSFMNSKRSRINGAAASSETPVNSQRDIVLNNLADFVPVDTFLNNLQNSGDLSLPPVNKTGLNPMVSKRLKRKLKHISRGKRCDASVPGSKDKVCLSASPGVTLNGHNRNGPLACDIIAEHRRSFNGGDVNVNVLEEPAYSANSVEDGMVLLNSQNQTCHTDRDVIDDTKMNSDRSHHISDDADNFKLRYSPHIVDSVKQESSENCFDQDGDARDSGKTHSPESAQYPGIGCKEEDIFDSDDVNSLVDKLGYRSDFDEHHDCRIGQNMCPNSSSGSSPFNMDHLSAQSSVNFTNHDGQNLNSNLYLESLLEVVLRPSSSVDSPEAECGSFGCRPKMRKFYRCPFCEKEFKAKSHAIRHSSSHTSMKYDCDVCGKKFSRADSVKRHCDSVHRVPNTAVDESSPPAVPPAALDATIAEPDAGQLTMHDQKIT